MKYQTNKLTLVKSALVFFAGTQLAFMVHAQSVNTVLLSQPTTPPLNAVPDQRGDKSLNFSEPGGAAKKWSLYWGWNRSNYSDSDIHFKGENHDFTLHNVRATDKQSPVSLNYLNPFEFTGPQSNFRLAYQFASDMAVALNLDHMKYNVTLDQSVPISGQINGVTQSGARDLSQVSQFEYEHCDGLNVLSLELEKQYPVGWFGDRHPSKAFVLGGPGLVITRSGVDISGLVPDREHNHQFHLSGYSYGAGVGLEVTVWEDVFVRTAFKVGHVNLPDVVTTAQGDRASQEFDYREILIAVGMRF